MRQYLWFSPVSSNREGALYSTPYCRPLALFMKNSRLHLCDLEFLLEPVNDWDWLISGFLWFPTMCEEGQAGRELRVTLEEHWDLLLLLGLLDSILIMATLDLLVLQICKFPLMLYKTEVAACVPARYTWWSVHSFTLMSYQAFICQRKNYKSLSPSSSFKRRI